VRDQFWWFHIDARWDSCGSIWGFMKMFLRNIRFRMSIKPKLDSILFDIVEVITIFLCPNDVKPSGWAGSKASIDSDIQFRTWSKPIVEIMIADEWFSIQEDLADFH
jgi:hypothetical protein